MHHRHWCWWWEHHTVNVVVVIIDSIIVICRKEQWTDSSVVAVIIIVVVVDCNCRRSWWHDIKIGFRSSVSGSLVSSALDFLTIHLHTKLRTTTEETFSLISSSTIKRSRICTTRLLDLKSSTRRMQSVSQLASFSEKCWLHELCTGFSNSKCKPGKNDASLIVAGDISHGFDHLEKTFNMLTSEMECSNLIEKNNT